MSEFQMNLSLVCTVQDHLFVSGKELDGVSEILFLDIFFLVGVDRKVQLSGLFRFVVRNVSNQTSRFGVQY